jgi:uroporphyrin-III C-methyltransferase/precorrin-2 dehydrogenase/sirohydrochlorin ferrochelatase
MDVLPIALKLTGQLCLVVGGGAIARRKADLLVQAGARLHVIAPEVLPELAQLAQASGGLVTLATYSSSHDLKSYRLVIAATNDPAVNSQVFEDSEALNILVNSVDDPPHCRFMIPAIIDRSPLVLSVSSGGASPVLARQLRSKIESLIPEKFGELAKFSGDWRPQVKAVIVNPNQRRIFWENLYVSTIGEQVLNGLRAAADAAMPKVLADWQVNAQQQGEVYLVGAGPGDPDLLTFKALRLMQQADVVVYDRLVSKPILALVRRDADRIYVGKARADHAVPQEDINQLLVRLAKEGKRVCRLKGGDPFIFGRGGEEIEELVAAGVAFQVVPGITAASGCSAYAGIPLTHRDYAQSVRFLTGHLKEGSPELPWDELVYENQTLVLYMGLVGLRNICKQLIAHGLREDMPVALISKGTTPDQQVIVGTVATIADLIEGQHVPAPTLTIIGEVVKLRDKLKWFE